MPLDVFPGLDVFEIGDFRVFNVLELVLYVSVPCNIGFVYFFLLSGAYFPKLEIIVEYRFGYETAWNGWPLIFHFISINGILLIFIKVSNEDDWLAVAQLLRRPILAFRLLVAARFNVVSMILLKVFKLVVHINRSLNVLLQFDVNCTMFIGECAAMHVFIRHVELVLTLYVVARDMLDNSIALANHVGTQAETDNTNEYELKAYILSCQLWSISVYDLLFPFRFSYSLNAINSLLFQVLIFLRHFCLEIGRAHV